MKLLFNPLRSFIQIKKEMQQNFIPSKSKSLGKQKQSNFTRKQAENLFYRINKNQLTIKDFTTPRSRMES